MADAASPRLAGRLSRPPRGWPFSNQARRHLHRRDPLGGTSDFTATIHWGDGNTSTGTVLLVSHGASSSSYQVLGGHTYAVAERTRHRVDCRCRRFHGQHQPHATIATVPSNILLLIPTQAGALTVTGQGQIKVSGTVQVDSNSSKALQESGKASISAGHIDIVGGDQISGQATTSVSPSSGSVRGRSADGVRRPQSGDISPHQQGAVTLTGKNTDHQPGILHIDHGLRPGDVDPAARYLCPCGRGLLVSGQATVNGPGVMIYNAGSNFVNNGAAGGTFAPSTSAARPTSTSRR